MAEENPRIVSAIVGREVIQHVDTPVGFRFLVQIFIGPGAEIIARVSSEFPFERLREGALDQIVEVIRTQLHLVEDVRKKRAAAENS